MSKNYEVLNDLVPKTQELHRAIFDRGYEQGYEDNKEEEYKNTELLDAYQRGLEDAWTASLTIMNMDENDIAEVFGIDYTSTRILRDYTASEAIGNINEWGERKKKSKITVGDEVNVSGFHSPVVVIALHDNEVKVMNSFGDTGVHSKYNITKTGRHLDQISEVFEQLKSEE